ncbi:FAD:protein FMN transferase [Rhodobacteraceae bacterium RKSG542]|uniref:FAD:protein FMN transferase n=1 Tax=Pseudovibrio flavus TaxID=2529854 RepID=UPI0012BD1AE8|nr:FAD:protein FMN transferase [Pseudovibrio flavus]MTI16047.1 FAD:protein FMN transferase [Pseudovibrio flavus]
MRLFSIFAALLFLAACSPENTSREIYNVSGSTMGTTYNIKAIVPESAISQEELHSEVEMALTAVNNRLSNWVKTSEVERFNASTSTEWTPVSGDMAIIMEEAFRIHDQSAGRFDVTLAPLIDLWGFGPSKDTPARPSREAIKDALDSVGMLTMLEFEASPPALRKINPTTSINLSAIAKGYGVDKIARTLEENGFSEYMVEIGGDLYAKGKNAKNTPWVVGIEKPVSGERAIQEIVKISNKGLATSGDYRNYKEVDGKRLSHIIDPVTGEPIDHKLASVTVIADTAARADGLATALLAMGDKRGMRMAEANGIATYMIVRNGNEFVELASPAFTKLLNESEQSSENK